MKKLILSLILFSCSYLYTQTWTAVNDKQAFNGGGQNTVACGPFTLPLTAGSTIIMTVRTSGVATTCADTALNTYVDGGQLQKDMGVPGSSSEFFQIFVAQNTHTTASNIVTCSFSITSNSAGCDATEVTVSGGGGVVSVDGPGNFATGQATGACGANSLVIPNFTTTINGDFIYAAFLEQALPITAGTSPLLFTLLSASVSPVAMTSESTKQTTAGNTGPTEGCAGGSQTYGGMSLALKSTSASVPTQIGGFLVGP